MIARTPLSWPFARSRNKSSSTWNHEAFGLPGTGAGGHQNGQTVLCSLPCLKLVREWLPISRHALCRGPVERRHQVWMQEIAVQVA